MAFIRSITSRDRLSLILNDAKLRSPAQSPETLPRTHEKPGGLAGPPGDAPTSIRVLNGDRLNGSSPPVYSVADKETRFRPMCGSRATPHQGRKDLTDDSRPGPPVPASIGATQLMG